MGAVIAGFTPAHGDGTTIIINPITQQVMLSPLMLALIYAGL